MVDQASCVVISLTLSYEIIRQNISSIRILDKIINFLSIFFYIVKFYISFKFGCNLDVRDAINTILIGVDEDGGDGKAKKNESTKESDLSD